MRPGEALGLRWEDIDRAEGILKVSGTLKEERSIAPGGKGVVKLVRDDPKTFSSSRTLPISQALDAALGRQLLYREMAEISGGSEWNDSGYVIITSRGTPFHISNLRKSFKKFLKINKIRYIRMHDMRHTVAHISLNDAATPIEQTSQALGHSRIETTKHIYAGNVPRYNREFIRGLEDILPKAPTLNKRNNDFDRMPNE
jgi:integrase